MPLLLFKLPCICIIYKLKNTDFVVFFFFLVFSFFFFTKPKRSLLNNQPINIQQPKQHRACQTWSKLLKPFLRKKTKVHFPHTHTRARTQNKPKKK